MATSFCYLGKCKACAPLKVDVLGVDEGTEGVEWFTREEVGFRSLMSRVRRKVRTSIFIVLAHIFKVVQQIGHCFALAIGQDIVVVDLASRCELSVSGP